MWGHTPMPCAFVIADVHSRPRKHRHWAFRGAGMGTSRCTRMDVSVPQASSHGRSQQHAHMSMRATTQVSICRYMFFSVLWSQERPLPVLLPQPGAKPGEDPVPERAAPTRIPPAQTTPSRLLRATSVCRANGPRERPFHQ